MARITLFTGEHPEEAFAARRAQQTKKELEKLGHTVKVIRLRDLITIQKVVHKIASATTQEEANGIIDNIYQKFIANGSWAIATRLADKNKDAHVFTIHTTNFAGNVKPTCSGLLVTRPNPLTEHFSEFHKRLTENASVIGYDYKGYDAHGIIEIDAAPYEKLAGKAERTVREKYKKTMRYVQKWIRNAPDKSDAKLFLELLKEDRGRLFEYAPYHKEGDIASQEHDKALARKIHEIVMN